MIGFVIESGKNDRQFKVTDSHVHCKSSSISKMMQDTHVVTTPLP